MMVEPVSARSPPPTTLVPVSSDRQMQQRSTRPLSDCCKVCVPLILSCEVHVTSATETDHEMGPSGSTTILDR